MKIKLFIFSFLLICVGCEDKVSVRDNVLDSGNEDYESPTITLNSGLLDGEVINSETVSFIVEGNELVTEYRFKLDSNLWSNWSDESTITFSYLDEGDHTVYFQSRYESGDTSNTIETSFVVDAVSGPALMFYPRRHQVNQGTTVTFNLLAEEVSDLMAAEINISYNPTKVQFLDISQGDFFQSGQESIFSYEHNSGSIEILTSLLNSENPSVSGTGSLLNISFRKLQQGNSSIAFTGDNFFRDPNNQNIIISESVEGLIAD
jgi:hypothetical protein